MFKLVVVEPSRSYFSPKNPEMLWGTWHENSCPQVSLGSPCMQWKFFLLYTFWTKAKIWKSKGRNYLWYPTVLQSSEILISEGRGRIVLAIHGKWWHGMSGIPIPWTCPNRPLDMQCVAHLKKIGVGVT